MSITPMLERWGPVLCVAAILLCVAGLVVFSLPGIRYEAQADEGIYLSYGVRIAQEGWGAFPGLLREYQAAGADRRFFPSPLRVTTLWLDAAAIRLAGPGFTSLSLLSLFAFLALLGVMGFGLRREFGASTACWTLLLLAASPLHLGLARRALSDTIHSLFWAVSLWLLLWALHSRGRERFLRWSGVALVYALTFLVKESGFLLIPIGAGLIAWHSLRRRSGFPAGPLCAVSWAPLLLAGGIVAWLAGGGELVWQTARFFGSGAGTNAYAQRYQDGPWFRFLVDWMLVSPWVVILYGLWLGVLIGTRPRDERAVFWALIPVLYLAGASLFPYGKNLRFILFTDVPMRLCAVLFLQRLLGTGAREGGIRPVIGMGAVVLALMWADLESFQRLFVQGGIYDPVSLPLLTSRRFLVP